MSEERFGTYDEIVGMSSGNKVSKVESISKGKRSRKSSVEASSSISKVFKFEHVSLERKECAEYVIVESDKEELGKVSVQKDSVIEEIVFASPTHYEENCLDVDLRFLV